MHYRLARPEHPKHRTRIARAAGVEDAASLDVLELRYGRRRWVPALVTDTRTGEVHQLDPPRRLLRRLGVGAAQTSWDHLKALAPWFSVAFLLVLIFVDFEKIPHIETYLAWLPVLLGFAAPVWCAILIVGLVVGFHRHRRDQRRVARFESEFGAVVDEFTAAAG